MTGNQKRYLRSLAHELRPLVKIGKLGITPGVIRQVLDNLKAHELVKVQLQKVHGPERKELGEVLAESTESELVQVIGGMVLLYKPPPTNPAIKLPKASS